MAGSARKIYNAAKAAPEDHSVILLAHNGPTALTAFLLIGHIVKISTEPSELLAGSGLEYISCKDTEA